MQGSECGAGREAEIWRIKELEVQFESSLRVNSQFSWNLTFLVIGFSRLHCHPVPHFKVHPLVPVYRPKEDHYEEQCLPSLNYSRLGIFYHSFGPFSPIILRNAV